MLDKFWEAVGGRLVDRCAAAAAPAVLFWLGGLLAWAYSGGGVHRLRSITQGATHQSTVSQVLVVLAVLLCVGASVVVVDRFTTPALRLLEGYWPQWLAPLRAHLVMRVEDRAKRDADTWQRLAPVVLEHWDTATAKDLTDF